MSAQDQLQAKLKDVWAACITTFHMLKADGLFSLDHLKSFGKDLVFPLKPELLTNPTELQKIAFVQTEELTVRWPPAARPQSPAH